MPVLKAKKAMRTLEGGQLLRIEATDPGATNDFKALCETDGHELLENNENDGVLTFVLKKAG